MHFLRTTDITSGLIDWSTVPWCFVPEADIEKYRLHNGDVVISRAGSVGFSCLIYAPQRSVFASYLIRFRPVIDAKYFSYFLHTPAYWEAIGAQSLGIAVQNVNASRLSEIPLPLAPSNEQARIVEKLEELLSDLDAGVAELRAAQHKLAQYRQSLLKAAVEGALTADWRAARAQSGEPEETGATLLQRILTDRRTRWETKQLAKFAEQGKTPPKGWQSKYPEPVAPDTADLPVLPEGWVWASVDQLTEFVTSGSRGWADYYADRGATFIRSHNINKDWLDLSDTAFVDPPKNSEGARTRIKRNDLLLTITGANVGKSAWVNVELEEAYVSQHVALIRPVESDISAYLHLFLTCKAGGRGQLDREAYGAGKPGLNLQQILSVVVPLPSPRELPELLSAVASIIDAATTQETSIAHALQQSAAQRKNILKAAFAGQLVPQDPSDEPASALLERICAERDNPKHASTRSRRTKQPKRPVEPDA